MNAAVCVVLAGLASGAAAQWYNGDPDNVNGLSAEFNTDPVASSFVFENFDHGGGVVNGVWGNFYISTNIRGCIYEIRSGVSNGFGGTLLAGGDVGQHWERWRNGYDNFGFVGYTIAVEIPDLNLPAGEYMLALSVIGDGTGRAFVQTTSGRNSICTPINDGRCWFQSDYFGVHYGDAGNELGYPCNFSYGVGFCYPPAPSSLAVLVLAGLGGRRRR